MIGHTFSFLYFGREAPHSHLENYVILMWSSGRQHINEFMLSHRLGNISFCEFLWSQDGYWILSSWYPRWWINPNECWVLLCDCCPRPGHWSSLSVSGPPIAWNITSSEQRQNWFKWASVFLNILGEAGCLICDCCPVVSICSSLRPVCSLSVNEQALTLKKSSKA